jgi:GT2 family glycosyltransferase
VGMDRDKLLAGRSDLRFVDTGKPINAAPARNAGAALARGDIYCFIDADCLAAPDWIERMLERHAQGAQVVCGGVNLPPGRYWTLCDNLAVLAEFIDTNAPGERLHMASLNFSIRAAVFQAVGAFDEWFRRACEDTDLSFRLRQAGYQIIFEPRASVAHYPARYGAGDTWAHLRLFGAGYRILYGKHAPAVERSLRVEICRRFPWQAAALAPALAALDSALFYLRHPSLARYWYALPGVIWARLGWYAGLIFGPTPGGGAMP